MMNTPIDASKVTQVYSGKPGCMCGCRGKHYYPNRNVDAAGKARGYALDAEDISDKQVTRITNLLNKNPAAKVGEGGEWAEVTIGQRIYVAYFTL